MFRPDSKFLTCAAEKDPTSLCPSHAVHHNFLALLAEHPLHEALPPRNTSGLFAMPQTIQLWHATQRNVWFWPSKKCLICEAGNESAFFCVLHTVHMSCLAFDAQLMRAGLAEWNALGTFSALHTLHVWHATQRNVWFLSAKKFLICESWNESALFFVLHTVHLSCLAFDTQLMHVGLADWNASGSFSVLHT